MKRPKQYQKNKILNEHQLVRKLDTIDDDYTQKERIEDELVRVKGFLIAAKLRHPLPITIDEAIASVKKAMEMMDGK